MAPMPVIVSATLAVGNFSDSRSLENVAHINYTQITNCTLPVTSTVLMKLKDFERSQAVSRLLE